MREPLEDRLVGKGKMRTGDLRMTEDRDRESDGNRDKDRDRDKDRWSVGCGEKGKEGCTCCAGVIKCIVG